jgi:YD repeat-containing protein
MASLPDDPRIAFSDLGYYSAVIASASAAAIDRDHALVVAPPSRSGFVWDRVSIDGVIVIDPLVGEPALADQRARRIPFVTIGHDPEPDGASASVSVDEATGTDLILDHLAERGARSIALLTLPPITAFSRETTLAYHGWCRRCGRRPVEVRVELEGLLGDEEEHLRRAASELRDLGADAVFAPIEVIGVGTLGALQGLGVRVPDDMLLATTRDTNVVASLDPAITTLSYDYDDMGRRAADMLLDLVTGVREAPLLDTVPTFLEPRASTMRTRA